MNSTHNVCTMVRKPQGLEWLVSSRHSFAKLPTESWQELTHQRISRATSDWHAFLPQTISAVLFTVVCCIHLISCTHSLYTEALHYNNHLPLTVPRTLHENLHSIEDAAFLVYQIKMSCTELIYCSSAVPLFFSWTQLSGNERSQIFTLVNCNLFVDGLSTTHI